MSGMDTVALSPQELMTQTLEAVAAADVDIVPLYFERFFARWPEQEGLFHNRASSQGTMINEMIGMLLAGAEGADWVPMFMRAQVTTHHDHGGIMLEHYRASLDLLIEVLAEAAGPGWNAAQDRAWREATASLFALIEDYF